ncbi:uncharacterized protein A1O9_07246 [Exophiala aquamarina CBS 119918]|uniref:GAT domain-containing protein n=1 Tax=Exophiala aquamarina CBS 119918 TaxID=1182545 RepID=A0A072PB02_9EURO|nr:uncharacterized protein A1O9_07246 [Exophiala aquamarina CBS 119918]KEF57056.1 hypothetical protein A1O9_07246 [Exophiala aquamarina CBS 119918]
MKKLLKTINKKSGSPERNGSIPPVLPQGDAPEAIVVREVTAFCESGAPNAPNSGEEYLHLPTIVDAAESSPTAAKDAAATIRRYLSKDHYSRGFAQYNAIMLTRILTDNPAHVFTQNFDVKFVATVKELLRDGKDTSVQQILRETLDYFEVEKLPGNDTLNPLMEMWRKEKGKRNTLRYSVGWSSLEAVSTDHQTEHQQQQHRVPPTFHPGRQQSTRRRDVLPPPDELVSRIEEAKTTARLLVQTVQSTPQSELLANDLVREFGERAKGAQRSIQGFLNAQNPAPDPDTMLTLIETNDQLNIAMSKHQRSILQARKSTGLGTPSPQNETPINPLSMPQHNLGQNVYNSPTSPNQGPYSVSPPRQPTQIPSPVSPMRNEERFSPPPGPPPAARGAVKSQAVHTPTSSFDYASAYAAPPGPPPSAGYTAPSAPPPVPDRARPLSQGFSEPPVVSTTAYGVSENPFADGAYGEDTQPVRRPHALFDRSHNTPSPPSDQQRPGGYPTTQSYVQRQDSSTANIAVHGTGGSAELHEQAQRAGSPIDETQGAQKQMNDLRI